MKVQELINMLQKYNPELEIRVYMEDEDVDFPIEDVEYNTDFVDNCPMIVVVR